MGSKRTRQPQLNSLGSDDSKSLSNLVNLYFNAAEQMIKSEDYTRLFSPELLTKVVAALPAELLAAYPQVPELMETYKDQLKDPEQLRQVALQGLQAMREYSSEMLRALSDPASMEMFMSQLPLEVRSLLASLQELLNTASAEDGGLSLAAVAKKVSALVDTLPSLSVQQRRLLKALLAGDGAGLMQEMSSVASDPEQVEAARLQLLENPALAAAIGVGPDVTQDPKKWAALMAKGMDGLTAAMSGAGTGAGQGVSDSAEESGSVDQYVDELLGKLGLGLEGEEGTDGAGQKEVEALLDGLLRERGARAA